MKSILGILIAAIVATGVMVNDAQAKRLGGGTSFGAKPSYSQAYKKPQSTPDQGNRQTAGAATSTGGAAKGAGIGAKSGLMGMLGGLAMGGLIGALLFGGAFENINFLDIAIFALIAFVLFKLLANRRRTATPSAATAGYSGAGAEFRAEQQPHHSQRSMDTDLLFKDKGETTPLTQRPDAVESHVPLATSVPKGFDAEHFLEGAKSAYARLQRAWDIGDLGDIRLFTTDKVFAEIQQQLHHRQGENHTEILDLSADLVQAQELSDELEASVLYRATLREEADAEAIEVQEIWHFIKPKRSLQPTWYLDGIQQVSA